MSVYLIGDLHKDWRPIRNFFIRNKEMLDKDDDIKIICLGDFGGLYYLDKRDDIFKEKISKYNATFFIIRGNHEQRVSTVVKENPVEWAIDSMFEGSVYYEKKYPNIKYALDFPSIYKICGKSVLTLPGAYSVDKYYRLQNGLNWFEEEQLSDYELELGKAYLAWKNYKVDAILSHTCPLCLQPTDLFLSVVDQSLVENRMEQAFNEIMKEVDYKVWVWGHYHQYREYEGTPRHLMLFNDKVVEFNNIVDEEEIKIY